MSERCEHCGCDKIYSGPPDCPRCGAPNCCEVCCREQELNDRIAELERQIADVQELLFGTDEPLGEYIDRDKLNDLFRKLRIAAALAPKDAEI